MSDDPTLISVQISASRVDPSCFTHTCRQTERPAVSVAKRLSVSDYNRPLGLVALCSICYVGELTCQHVVSKLGHPI